MKARHELRWVFFVQAVLLVVAAWRNLQQLNPDAIARAKTPDGRGELEQSLGAHLQTVNATLDPHEQLDALIVVTEPWSVDNGFVTPTFKVKRNRVEEVYAANFERWADARKKVQWVDG